jgi:hypothetical protein
MGIGEGGGGGGGAIWRAHAACQWRNTCETKAFHLLSQLMLQFVFVAAIQFIFKDAPTTTIVLSSQTVSASTIRCRML